MNVSIFLRNNPPACFCYPSFATIPNLLGYLIFVILCKANVESTGIMGLDINPVALASKFTLFAHDAKNTSKLRRNGKECFSC